MIRLHLNPILKDHPELVALAHEGYLLNGEGLKELDNMLQGLQASIEDELPPLLELLPVELEPAGNRLTSYVNGVLLELRQFRQAQNDYLARRNDE